MADLSILSQLSDVSNLGVQSTIEKLIQIFKEARLNPDQSVPTVTVRLKNGDAILGHALSISSGSERKSLILANAKGLVADVADLSYILIEEIVAITVHDAPKIIDHLSHGKIARLLKVTPTLDAIQTDWQKVVNEANSTFLLDLKADPIVIDASILTPATLQNLMLSVRDLSFILTMLATQDLTHEALQQKPLRFQLNVGDEAKIEVVDALCKIYLGRQGDDVERVARETLHSSIIDAFFRPVTY